MIVLADEILENFFDHEFSASFVLTEKPVEQQRSLGREIFDNLLATGTKLASTTVRPQFKTKSTDTSSISTSEVHNTIEAIENVKITEDAVEQQQERTMTEHKEKEDKKPQDDHKAQENQNSSEQISAKQDVSDEITERHVLGNDSDDDDDDDDLSPDVLEEVDRLLNEYSDDENEEDKD